ncbi:MAG: tetratricopeptide repeat protein [Lutibacter sp.]|nr:MAG: tetratricopeptide repeat protein [Lutibacter sp.]
MKPNYFLLLILTTLFISCSKSTITPEFIKQTEGRYLYNPDETIEVYFEENELFMKWRGAEKITPMNLGNNVFFIKEMNEKVQFQINPIDRLQYLCLIPKEKNESISYDFRKLNNDENVPSVYLKNKEYDKALKGYLAIKEKDTANIYTKESNFNSLGYRELREKNYIDAIKIFELNTALYPESENVYDSLAEAYFRSGDTINAVDNYKKALAIDSGNRRAKEFVKKHER